MMSKINKSIATRTQFVGPSIASIVIPQNGMVDTNVWDSSEGGWIAYTPQMIFANGSQIGASKFPIKLSLFLDGQLPEQSIFFKSIVDKICKKRNRRLIFNRRTGPYIPGPLGLIGLALFGKIPNGFEDFGLNPSKTED